MRSCRSKQVESVSRISPFFEGVKPSIQNGNAAKKFGDTQDLADISRIAEMRDALDIGRCSHEEHQTGQHHGHNKWGCQHPIDPFCPFCGSNERCFTLE